MMLRLWHILTPPKRNGMAGQVRNAYNLLTIFFAADSLRSQTLSPSPLLLSHRSAGSYQPLPYGVKAPHLNSHLEGAEIYSSSQPKWPTFHLDIMIYSTKKVEKKTHVFCDSSDIFFSNPLSPPKKKTSRTPQFFNIILLFKKKYTPEKLTCPLKWDYFNRKYIFQPSFFRGYVSFQGCTSSKNSPPKNLSVFHHNILTTTSPCSGRAIGLFLFRAESWWTWRWKRHDKTGEISGAQQQRGHQNFIHKYPPGN